MSVWTMIALALSSLALAVGPGGGGSGGGGGAFCECKDDCEQVKKDCEEWIDFLGPLCALAPGGRAYCKNAKDRGCKADETYCKVMCEVDFDDCAPPRSPDREGGDRGTSLGDPHLTTFDGIFYNFQSVGEFVLAEALDDSLAVHVRQKSLTSTAAVNAALAVRLGDTLVQIDERDADGPSAVVVGDESFALAQVDGLWRGDVHLRFDGVRLDVISPDKGVVSVSFASFTDVVVTLPGGAGLTRGLLGNHDGRLTNDLIGPETVGAESWWAWIHGAYADQWRLDDATSLLPYRDGETTATFTDLAFPMAPLSPDEAALAAALEACADAGLVEEADLLSCAYDIVATGDFGIAIGYPMVARAPRIVIDEGARPVPGLAPDDPAIWDDFDPDAALETFEAPFELACALQEETDVFCDCLWDRYETVSPSYPSDNVATAAHMMAVWGRDARSEGYDSIAAYGEILFGPVGNSFDEIVERIEWIDGSWLILDEAFDDLDQLCPNPD